MSSNLVTLFTHKDFVGRSRRLTKVQLIEYFTMFSTLYNGLFKFSAYWPEMLQRVSEMGHGGLRRIEMSFGLSSMVDGYHGVWCIWIRTPKSIYCSIPSITLYFTEIYIMYINVLRLCGRLWLVELVLYFCLPSECVQSMHQRCQYGADTALVYSFLFKYLVCLSVIP